MRVNGPLLDIEGLTGAAALLDLVEVGEDHLPGEVVALSGDRVVVQVYEYTGGVGPGTRVLGHRRPLSVALGPWLLGGVFDGLLRPCSTPLSGLRPAPSGPSQGNWAIAPRTRIGEVVSPGAVLVEASTPGVSRHDVPVPVGVAGTVTWVAAPGSTGRRIRSPPSAV